MKEVLEGMERRMSGDLPAKYSLTYFKEEWIESSKEDKKDINSAESVIIFEMPDYPLDFYNTDLDENKVISVIKGDCYKQVSSRQYEVNPHNYEDYLRLFNEIIREGVQIGSIVYLWFLDDAELKNFNSTKALKRELSSPDVFKENMMEVTDLFYFTKALITTHIKGLRKLLLFSLKQDQYDNPFIDMIVPYGKSLKLLLPDLNSSFVHINKISQVTESILTELVRTNSEAEIYYKENGRFIISYKMVKLIDKKGTGIKDRSTCLITGGAGKLGMIFANYLYDKYSANIVLIGHSELNGSKRTEVDNLIKKGCNVFYQIADVTDIEQMRAAIRNADERFGGIHTVIHAAGIVSEKNIAVKSLNEFIKIISVKALGAFVLDEVTKNEPIQNFILFSSISSIIGDFGQCDYAIGNRFLDCFKDIRKNLCEKELRQGRTLVINWPLWKSGGMNQDKEAEHLYLHTSGLDYLSTSDGIKIFESMIHSDLEQGIVLYGDELKVKKILQADMPICYENRYEQGGLVEIKEEEGGTELDGKLIILAADILKNDVKELDVNTNFGDMGFDSISLKSYAKAVSEKFNIEITPTVFFAASTAKKLADYIEKEFQLGDQKQTQTAKLQKNEGIKKFSGKLEPFCRLHPELAEQNKVMNGKCEDVAIIGAEGLFPQSDNLTEYWENLEGEKDLITEVPRDRWDWRIYYSTDRSAPNKTVSKCGGFINHVDMFDAKFFNISRLEAELMDPQHRLLLQEVWKVIEDAGYKASMLSGKNVGVFIGTQFNDYQELLHECGEIKPQLVTGNSQALLANRISYYMNFMGPSETIDTACSSSLVAVHHAIQSIQRGESELAVAGGVSLMLSPKTFISASKLGVLSPDNHCKTFDEGANGYVRGEGVGVVLLKPLNQAIKDKDHIYAVIRGSAENHGGRASSLTAPNSTAQAALLTRAYREACVDINTITYIEAHGTGTELGDPVEIEGLKKAFDNLMTDSDKKTGTMPFCGIGSVKTNIGHLEPAAGIAGILKVILAMKYKKLPASILLNKINPYIKLDNSPFYIVEKTREWGNLKDDEGNLIPRRAGISSFGFGGTNAHVILEEFEETQEDVSAGSSQIVILSAKDMERLTEYATDLYEYLLKEDESECRLSDIAFTLQNGRESMDQRAAMVVRDAKDLLISLKGFLNGDSLPNVVCSNRKENQTTAAILGGDEDVKDLISNWYKKGKLLKIARLWSVGYDVDWKVLNQGDNRHRVSLPTYPFKKERYWLPFNSKEKFDNFDKKSSLIDSFDYQSYLDEGVIFYKELSSKENIISDHVIDDKKIFPGVGYIEMAYQAAMQVLKNKRLVFERVFWLHPLIVDGEKQKIYLVLRRTDNKLVFEIKNSHEAASTIYAKGELAEASDNSIQDECIPIDEILNRCNEKLNSAEIYQQYEKSGIRYGEFFKGITKVYRNSEEAIGSIKLPSGEGLDHYTLHPSLLDSALQTISCISKENGKIYLPYVLGKLEIVRPLKTEMYAYVKPDGKNSYKILVTDEYGNVCFKFSDYTFRESKRQPGHMFYGQTWKKVPVKEQDQVLNHDSNGTAFIIYNNSSKKIAEKISLKYSDSINVKIGKQNIRVSGNQWEAKADDQDALAKIISQIGEIDTIYYLSGIQFCNVDSDDYKSIREIQEEGVITLFRLIKALDDKHFITKIKELKIIINNTQRVETENVILPNSASISGFVKTLAKEYVNLKITLLDLDLMQTEDKDLETAIAPVFYEPHNNAGELIVYREDRRYEKIIETVDLPKPGNSAFKQEGVYIIIGGLGGIGALLSRYLAASFHAKMFLVGRSELDEKRKLLLEEIEKVGGMVSYYRADINDYNQMEKAVKEAKRIYGNQINAVFHSAIVPLDRSIHNMSETEFRSASDLKIYGSLVLHSLFKNDKLDFMAFFSSTSSQAGMPGQSNYVSGLNFMDNYAEYIEAKVSYPVKVINWGYWGIGSSEKEEFRKKMQAQGIYAISADEGMEALERILGNEKRQTMVLKAGPKVLNQLGIKDKEALETDSNYNADHLDVFEKTGDSVEEGVDNFIKEMLSNILKCPADTIDNTTEFEEFGIDSILGFQILAELEKTFPGLPATLFLDYTNVKQLTRYFMDNYAEQVNEMFGVKNVADQNHDEICEEKESLAAVERQKLENQIKHIVASVLKCEAGDLDSDIRFDEFGIDSIIGFQILAELEKQLGTLPATLLFDNGTLNNVVDYLLTVHKEQVSSWLKSMKGRSDNTDNSREVKISGHINMADREMPVDLELPINLESFLVEIGPDTKMEVTVKGEGEPILFIPGLAVTSQISIYQFAELSSRYKVIGVNLPGHGKSDGIEDLSFKGISSVLMKVISELNICGPINVIGGSYGGIIAQNIALEFPQKVKSLILLGSITTTKFDGVAQIFSFTEAISEDFTKVKLNASTKSVIENIDYYFEIYKHSQETNRPILMRYLEMMKVKMTTRDVIDQIHVPTLIIVGKLDTVVDPAESALLHTKIKHSKLIEIADGGHFINLTHHEFVNEVIYEFLKSDHSYEKTEE
ncbi:alpha/beta fold hydrolase [Lacrimispora sp. 38-1]|uniref:alpha/beta fold hydrolase n=1 Tax=Lacrimispora sp. 38-1 TaxID=3125778 RepID=UPI003CF60372